MFEKSEFLLISCEISTKSFENVCHACAILLKKCKSQMSSVSASVIVQTLVCCVCVCLRERASGFINTVISPGPFPSV